MIVYREQRQTVRTADLLRRVRNARGLDRLIEAGEFEAAVTDALCPQQDGSSAVLRALREATLSAADPIREAQPWPDFADLPANVLAPVSEGYAYYAVHPDMYRRAAAAFWLERQPQRVAVIGIRSIGASLSAVVAAELRACGCEVLSWTVRPRGHPWDRRLRVSPELEREWRQHASTEFAIVDEGPGLSGSSFASVAEFLSSLGIPDERISLFPSWNPEPQKLLSLRARERWGKHRRYVTPFVRPASIPESRDVSGGAWREIVCGPPETWPAAQPQHERRKYLTADGCLYKFAGYGRYGAARFERAQRLARFTPAPLRLEDGFLVSRWVSGNAGIPPTGTVAEYLAFLRREFPCEPSTSFDELAQMLRVNVEEGLGLPEPDLERFRAAAQEGGAAGIDGRMMPHKWIETQGRFMKADALDHHDDHFYPGCQDIAWDLAGATIECGLNPADLLAQYERASGDWVSPERFAFYRLAYLAFRLGYCDMAAQALGDTADATRFRRVRRAYRGRLRRELSEVMHGR